VPVVKVLHLHTIHGRLLGKASSVELNPAHDQKKGKIRVYESRLDPKLSLDFFFEFRYQFNYDMKKREKELVLPKEPH
jgi:hypothetical protein